MSAGCQKTDRCWAVCTALGHSSTKLAGMVGRVGSLGACWA